MDTYKTWKTFFGNKAWGRIVENMCLMPSLNTQSFIKWPYIVHSDFRNAFLAYLFWPRQVFLKARFFKVHIFWEGRKILRNFPLLLTVSTVVKSKGEISQNFLAFSEYTNFNLYVNQLFSADSTMLKRLEKTTTKSSIL